MPQADPTVSLFATTLFKISAPANAPGVFALTTL
jgi:hypothetical protein